MQGICILSSVLWCVGGNISCPSSWHPDCFMHSNMARHFNWLLCRVVMARHFNWLLCRVVMARHFNWLLCRVVMARLVHTAYSAGP